VVRPYGRGRIGCVGALLLIAGLYGAAWGYDALIGAPWAYALGGRPTLTGSWTGRIDAVSGGGGLVQLEILRGSGARPSARRGLFEPHSTYRMFDYTRLGAHAILHGTATWCRSDGSASHYRLMGWATHDDDVTVTFDVITPPSRSREELRETRGHWDGGTGLTLAGPLRVYTVVPGQLTSTRAASTATGMTLHHVPTDASDTTCAHIGGSAP
jgi:hypothetical protein